MDEKSIASVIVLTLIMAIGIAVDTAANYLVRWMRSEKNGEPEESYQDKLKRLQTSLISASAEVDSLITEMQAVVNERTAIVTSLEQRHSQLLQDTEQLENLLQDLDQKRLSAPILESVIRDVEQRISEESSKSEKRNRRREMIIFAAGLFLGFISDVLASLIV